MPVEIAYVAYVIVGIVAGVLGGLLGVGGGMITVPCLFYIYHFLGYPQADRMHVAVATSLAAMIFTTLSATWAHHQKKGVLWPLFRKMIPGLVLGSMSGACIALWLSGVILEILFGVFLCLLAIRFYRQKVVAHGSRQVPGIPLLTLLSGGIGALSNLLGIGGGSLTVPLLTSFKIEDKKAIGTSAATTLLTSILGSLSYLFLGWESRVPGTAGLIDLPAFLILAITTAICAPYGVRLTHKISPLKVRKLFAIVLAITGISLII